MKLSRRILSVTIALALTVTPPQHAGAEDIDLFVGATSAAQNPNVLLVIDNSANWANAAQHWSDPNGVISPFKQGQSELRSLRTVVGELTDKINFGLMMFTEGATGTKVPTGPGGYARFHIRQMTAINRAALQELIGPDSGCVDGANSLNGTPNCIFKNFQGGEQTATAKTDYSATLFEAFKYFGGYTSPANAQTGIAGSPVDASHFGALRYAGAPDPKSDPAAYTDGAKTGYNPPISALNSCAKNYIIFIGNGFPVQDSPGTLLSGVEGSTTQLAMPQFTSTSTTETSIIGTQCATGNNATQRKNNCEAAIPQSLKDANPADSYSCINERVDASCAGSPNPRLFDVQASKLVITVTPTGTSATPSTSKARFADEWAKYLYTTDVNGAAGQQNAAIYTIDVFKDQQDVDQTALLLSTAKYGGGKYFQATSEDAILNALRQILIEIQSVNSVFASASLPISATNRSQNENQVFIGMFRPDAGAKPRWYGNLKRYQIALFSGEAKLADVDGAEAVSSATGFIQSCARSFWTTDSGTYWSFSPGSAGTCTTAGTDVFSDSPDGALVEKGATAEVVRKGNNPPTTDTTPTNAVNRTIYTCTDTSTCSDDAHLVTFDASNVSKTQLGDASMSDAVRDGIINYTRGVDVDDDNANTVYTDVRASVHGDVVHSRPLPVNYGDPTGVVLYYGANDGAFRAVRGSDGKELWAFFAPEHHAKLKRLKDNEPLVLYPNMTAPFPTPTPTKKDYFFDGSAGLFQNADNSKIWVFPTTRRGGRMLYGFDVTSPTSPSLKWRVGCPNPDNDTGCTSTDFTGIGQTWSFPNVALVRSFSATNPVIIMGGGYDACEDADTSTPSCGGAKGRKVYVINADTGDLIKSFDTDRSVIDVTLLDRDFDGFVDHGYVADTGGNLYRIDFVNPVTNWTITKIAFTAGSGRKFQFAPAALPGAGRVYLALGSGDRERPLISNYPYTTVDFPTPGQLGIQNRFYMFIDTFATGAAVNLDGANLTDFTSTTTCATSLDSSARGWRMDLNTGRGEQTVTSAVIFGGLVFFSTNRPVPTPPGACAANLGEARGYAVNLLNASGAVGTSDLCGASRSGIFIGSGLPPSPVTGTVLIGGKPVTVMIGGIQREGGASSPISAQKVKPTISQKRSRVYWYTQGDK